MTSQLVKPNVPPWLYKLFTGHQYPYVRRLAKFAQPIKPGEDRPEPTKDLIEAKFWEVYPRCWAKVLQEVKVGMIVVFHDLGEYPAGGYQELSMILTPFWPRPMARKRSKSISMMGTISSARSILKSPAGPNMNMREGSGVRRKGSLRFTFHASRFTR
jgi:hypothetical protein